MCVRAVSRETTAQFRSSSSRITDEAYCWRKLLSSLVTIALAATASTCGGGPSSTGVMTPTTPTPAPVAPVVPTITISPSGVSPREITVSVGDRVTFINNDVQPHDPAGGPDPATPDCREIDAVGFLVPGQSRQTALLPIARTCDYHDHSHHAPIFNGRIIIR